MDRQDAHILLVDDDPGIRSLVSTFLGREGYVVETAADARDMDGAIGRATTAGNPFDLIVLDLMLPGESGLDVIRRLRPANDAPAVVVLSAMGEVGDRIEGLELGADDYLAKPCNPRELLARIRAVLRRRQDQRTRADRASGTTVLFSGWRLDLLRRELRTPTGVLMNLSDGEFLLLNHFAENPRQVLSRETLLALSGHAESGDRSVDVQVSRLRRKLSSDTGDGSDLIRTVRNGGYMLASEVTRV
jgi:two-component system OmpR family response regulator